MESASWLKEEYWEALTLGGRLWTPVLESAGAVSNTGDSAGMVLKKK